MWSVLLNINNKIVQYLGGFGTSDLMIVRPIRFHKAITTTFCTVDSTASCVVIASLNVGHTNCQEKNQATDYFCCKQHIWAASSVHRQSLLTARKLHARLLKMALMERKRKQSTGVWEQKAGGAVWHVLIGEQVRWDIEWPVAWGYVISGRRLTSMSLLCGGKISITGMVTCTASNGDPW